MAGSAVEAASTSSECLSGEDSEPPPGQGSPTYHQLPQELIRTISEAHCRRPRNLRLHSKADVQPKPGVLFTGAASSSKVQKRTNQLARQRELAFKKRASRSPVSSVDLDRQQKAPHHNPRRTVTNQHPTEIEAGPSSARTPPRTPQSNTPASLKTALSTPGDFSPAWSHPVHETGSSDGDSHSTAGDLGPDWELTDPVARGLRQEIQRVRREKQSMLSKVREIDSQLEKLGKMMEKDV